MAGGWGVGRDEVWWRFLVADAWVGLMPWETAGGCEGVDGWMDERKGGRR